MLQINNISKTFFKNTPNEKIAINDLSLHLEQGDFVTIIGGNGAGKSTLFNSISGNFLVDSGSIFLGDENITYDKDYKRAKNIGYLFQNPSKGTAPNMTIEENLSLVYRRSGQDRSLFGINVKTRDFFKEKLASLDLGLENRLKTPVGLLSGGQRQALTLLMATIVPPKLLLLDEHTAALDPETARKVLALTTKIVRDNNLTCMMITHNITDALSLGNRTIMMDNGKIILDIKGEERENMTVDKLLKQFSENSKKAFDNDRILLSTAKDM